MYTFALSNNQKHKKMNKIFSLLAIGLLFITACTKDKESEELEIPSTYSFENVSYSGQTARLAMLAEMTTLMKTANTSGTTVSATDLKNMFTNENDPFISVDLNSNSKDIESKTFSGDVQLFEDYMDALASISGTTDVAASGQAGIATSGTKAYLLNAKGVEYTQLIEKGLMGALAYYNIAEVYTREDKIGNAVDNETVETGKGTPMEHHWDEAFGYIGANTAFEVSTYKYHAKYAAKGEDAGLKTRTNLLNAFLAGRAAISAKDMERKDLEAKNVRKYMEEVSVTTAIHYLNGAKENFTDYAIRCHQLSEAYAFIASLKYNSDKTISTTELNTVKSYLEDASSEPNFADLSIPDINSAIDLLSATFELDNVKATL